MRLILLVFLSILMSGCNPSSHEPTTNPDTAIQVRDSTGATVTLTQPAKRVIALAPHIVENVYTAGAGEQLVGVVAYSDFPEQVQSLPLVGGYAKTNYEMILQLKPDLVIAWESGNSDSSIDRIKQLGYPVYIDQPDTLTDIAKSINDIGILTGHSGQAEKAANDYLTRLESIKQKHRAAAPITTFYQVWNRPLQTINGTHFISDAMAVCGGVNAYAKETTLAPIINIESILERNPDVIIASGMGDSRPDWLDEWRKWPSLNAVQNDTLFFVNPDHIQRHTVRVIQGIEAICRQLDIARKRIASSQTIQQ